MAGLTVSSSCLSKLPVTQAWIVHRALEKEHKMMCVYMHVCVCPCVSMHVSRISLFKTPAEKIKAGN